MRLSLIAAVSAVALLGAAAQAEALVPAAAPVVQDAAAVTDAELEQFATAMSAIEPIAAALNGAAPNAEQQAAMAAAITDSGLELTRFNALSTAVSGDPVLRARLDVINAPEPAAGSVAAGVTDAEVSQFAAAMADVRPIAEALNGAAPNAEQQAAMAEAITATGLDLERFNAISGAVSQDQRLRARLALTEARDGGV